MDFIEFMGSVLLVVAPFFGGALIHEGHYWEGAIVLATVWLVYTTEDRRKLKRKDKHL